MYKGLARAKESVEKSFYDVVSVMDYAPVEQRAEYYALKDKLKVCYMMLDKKLIELGRTYRYEVSDSQIYQHSRGRMRNCHSHRIRISQPIWL